MIADAEQPVRSVQSVAGQAAGQTAGLAADELRERMADVFNAATERLRQEPQTAAHLHESLAAATVRAPLYLRHPLPNWPPSFLLRKIVRRFALPFLMPQVHFNESICNSLVEMTRLLEASNAAQQEQERRLADLTAQIERLTLEADDRSRRAIPAGAPS